MSAAKLVRLTASPSSANLLVVGVGLSPMLLPFRTGRRIEPRCERAFHSSIIAAIALLMLGPAKAQDCKLTQIASIEMSFASSGVPLVPITINGIPEKVWLDLEDPFSYLAADTAKSLGLEEELLPFPGGSTGADFTRWGVSHNEKLRAVTVHSLGLGSVIGKDVRLYLGEDSKNLAGVAGAVGLDVFGHYDVEVDFAKNKLNLFQPSPGCQGEVVYWTRLPAAAVDMQPMPGGTWHYAFALDGRPVTTSVYLDKPESLFSFLVAGEKFGIRKDSNEVAFSHKNGFGLELYSYPFKSLDASGLSIANPAVFLHGNANWWNAVCDSEEHNGYRCRGDAALRVGVHELRALHLYFAFGQKKLYLTAANAN